MVKLTKLSSKLHKEYRVVPNASMLFADKQHMLTLSAIELSQAATCFPLFITRSGVDGQLVFSAMTSFELGENLYVVNQKWDGRYQPNILRTYPLFLMQSESKENPYTVGFDEQSGALTNEVGSSLFEKDGQASPYLTGVTQTLESQLENIEQTYKFAEALERFNLLKEIDIKVYYQDQTVNTIQGLFTVNEEAFALLSGTQLEELNKAGYLTPIHSMLISLYLINDLINRNNLRIEKSKIVNVKMEVKKQAAYL